ncbi:hypothetical protein [Bartonella sp. MM73XJBT]|uniref:hypothetical protein n=1 Tax=Bartonella sp. MM73XJBT TaxID=3019095 RepID=UPI0023614765|nr:hypothetical protein [Bartonella sp. MM73XJBT]
MISHIGCEDGCGYVSQFLLGTFSVPLPTSRVGATLKTTLNALVGGGHWQQGSLSGPFYRSGQNTRTLKSDKLGARGCSRPRRYV